MAQKLKKGFFKVLPLSVVIFLVFGLVATFTLPTPENPRVEPALAGVVTMSSAVTADAIADGTVDQVTITFSEGTDINDTGAGADGLDSLTLTNSCTIADGDYSATNTLSLILTLTGCTASNTGITPTITYATQGGAGNNFAISDNATSTEMVNGVNVVATDGAAPRVLTATYLDNDGNGVVDRVRFNTTTDTGIACTPFTGGVDFTVGTAGTVVLVENALDTCASNGTSNFTITLANAALSNTTGGPIDPVVTYTQPGNGVEDGAGNDLPTAAGVTVADGAAPIIVNTYSADPDNDGDVNAIDLTFSENISDASVVAANFEFDNDVTNNTVGEEAVSGESTTVVYPAADADANDQYYRLTVTAGITGTEVAYLHHLTLGLTDTAFAANQLALGSALGTENDEADPIVMSTSPADNATDIALDANFVITFSEPMTQASITGAISRSPSFTLGSAAWTVGDTVVTYAAHDAWAGLQNYIITLAGTIASAASGDGNLDLTAVVANPFDFTTVASGGGGGGGGGLPASVTVTAPNGGETLTGGGTYNITWSTTGTVSDPISIYYSTDAGINFPNTVTTGETNDGSYTWTVPNAATTAAKIKVASGSLNDVSDANFSITYSASAVSAANSTVSATPTSVVANGTSKSTVTVTVKDASSNLLSGKVVTLTSSRGTSDTITTVTGTTGANGVATFEVKSNTAGTSTYTATAAGVVLSSTAAVVFAAPGEVGETPTVISVGDLIKSPLSTSVYYYGSDNKRHLFPNEKTYKSWYVDFSGIKSVTASQLQGLALGANVTVRAGTVLVKIQTDPKVYAVEPGGLLRWVPTEARAATLYGANWAQKIIDVPLVFWVDYTFGSDITTDKHPTGAVVQYTGTTDKYYIQGTDKRLISTAGFTANKFQLSNVLSVSTSITYTLGTPLVAEETALTRIY